MIRTLMRSFQNHNLALEAHKVGQQYQNLQERRLQLQDQAYEYCQILDSEFRQHQHQAQDKLDQHRLQLHQKFESEVDLIQQLQEENQAFYDSALERFMSFLQLHYTYDQAILNQEILRLDRDEIEGVLKEIIDYKKKCEHEIKDLKQLRQYYKELESQLDRLKLIDFHQKDSEKQTSNKIKDYIRQAKQECESERQATPLESMHIQSKIESLSYLDHLVRTQSQRDQLQKIKWHLEERYELAQHYQDHLNELNESKAMAYEDFNQAEAHQFQLEKQLKHAAKGIKQLCQPTLRRLYAQQDQIDADFKPLNRQLKGITKQLNSLSNRLDPHRKNWTKLQNTLVHLAEVEENLSPAYELSNQKQSLYDEVNDVKSCIEEIKSEIRFCHINKEYEQFGSLKETRSELFDQRSMLYSQINEIKDELALYKADFDQRNRLHKKKNKLKKSIPPYFKNNLRKEEDLIAQQEQVRLTLDPIRERKRKVTLLIQMWKQRQAFINSLIEQGQFYFLKPHQNRKKNSK